MRIGRYFIAFAALRLGSRDVKHGGLILLAILAALVVAAAIWATTH